MTTSPDLTFTLAEVRKAAEECGDIPPLDRDLARVWMAA